MKYSALAVATAALLCSPATAATLVDTGVPTGQGLGNGWALSPNQTLAGLFTLAGATTVTSVEGFILGLPATGTISIFTGGVDPASSGLLYSANFAIAASDMGDWQGVFGQSWHLAAGQYWVVFASDATVIANSMVYSPPNPLSQNAHRVSGSAWEQRGSRLGIGVRITDDVAPGNGAVPEPATWAMMIVGFGAIGGAMRSRRRMTVSYG